MIILIVSLCLYDVLHNYTDGFPWSQKSMATPYRFFRGATYSAWRRHTNGSRSARRRSFPLHSYRDLIWLGTLEYQRAAIGYQRWEIDARSRLLIYSVKRKKWQHA